MDQAQLLDTAIRAAREGGQQALEHYRKRGRITWKGNRDVVTAGTLAAQSRILEIIRAEFPEHAILSEELDEVPDPDAETLWIIDPIDGSLNYIRGLPFFAVAVGFRDKGLHRFGVVYDPLRDELFHAVRNKGAYLNGRTIITNQRFEGMEAYQAAMVATDWPAQVARRSEQAAIIERMVSHVVSLQILGSPVLSLCYIAAGRLDAYFHLNLGLWDVAAAAVILEESGGILTNIKGTGWQRSDGGYVASNGIIHGKMMASVKFILERE